METKSREATKLHKKLLHLVGEAVREFSLIQTGDHILLGLSGGKDSLAMLDLLGEIRRHSALRFELEAIHVRINDVDYLSDTTYLKEKAARWDVPLHVETIDFEQDRKAGRTPCFLCAWNRRKIFFSKAQQWGFNKIALGHHRDDILKTSLMNLTFSGSFSSMPVKLRMHKFPITIIRPLAKIPETYLQEWAEAQNYKPVTKVCPNDKLSNRTSVEAVLNAMRRLNKDFSHSLWHALAKAGKLVEDGEGEEERGSANT